MQNSSKMRFFFFCNFCNFANNYLICVMINGSALYWSMRGRDKDRRSRWGSAGAAVLDGLMLLYLIRWSLRGAFTPVEYENTSRQHCWLLTTVGIHYVISGGCQMLGTHRWDHACDHRHRSAGGRVTIQPRSRTHKISLSFLIWNVFDSSLHLPPYSLCDLFCQWVVRAVCAGDYYCTTAGCPSTLHRDCMGFWH